MLTPEKRSVLHGFFSRIKREKNFLLGLVLWSTLIAVLGLSILTYLELYLGMWKELISSLTE